MVSILSPGVYLVEKDVSNYPPSIGTTTVGIVGFATKGPTNKATLVTSQDNLVDQFGYPQSTMEGQGLVGALELLEITNSLYYVRVAASDAKNASATINIGSCPAFAVSSAGIGVASGAVFKVQVTDHTGKAGFSEIKTYTVPAGTAATQQEALARVFGTDIDTLKVTAQFPYTLTEAGDINPANSTSTRTLNGESVTVTAAGFIVGTYAGSGASISVSAFANGFGSLANDAPLSGIVMPLSAVNGDAFNFAYATDTNMGGAEFSAYTGGVISGITYSNLAYQVESLWPGTGYNLGVNEDKTIRGTSVEVDAFGGPQVKLIVNDSGGAAETYRVSFKDGDYYITDVINMTDQNAVSDYIKAYITSGGAIVSSPGKLTYHTDNVGLIVTGTFGIGAGQNTDAALSGLFVKLVEGTKALAGGTDGDSKTGADLDAVFIGDSAAKTGIYALDDDLLNLTLALVPGYHSQDVQNALVTLAETTTNFMAVLSPPIGLNSVQQAIDWSNGFSDERTAPLNSSYAALYWPHVQVFVPSFAKEDWLDAAIYGARQILFTATTSELWYAPAGFVRGRLTKPNDVEVRLGQGERDAMYSGGNAINPIVNFPRQGITIFGQRTAQRNPTALDRINVRLLAIFIKKQLLASVQNFLFEPNDPILWDEISTVVNSILSPIKAARGLNAYNVKCDETTNTPARRERGELWCKVIIQPTKAAEAIVFELNVASQSATIN